MHKIVLISSGQPSVNPRLVKEANFFSELGYEVFVLYSYWTHWAWKTDEQLFKSVKWKPILAGGSPFKNKLLYLTTKIRFKVLNTIANNFTLNFGVAEVAKGRATLELLKLAKSIKATLYIAHNLAALPIAIKAANYCNAKFGFDAEDFHRNEVSNFSGDFNYRISKYLEDKYLNECDYISAASPLIAENYKKLYPQINPVIINNVFELKHIQEASFSNDNRLKLFWFSQTIGRQRGIEDVISAINLLKNPLIELHLLGNITPDDKMYFEELSGNFSSYLFIYNPIAPDSIFKFANRFDIGLALELNTPFNREVCLTNKIFTYLVAGLAIIASNTLAQKAFIEKNNGIGSTYSNGDVKALALTIDNYFNDRQLLNSCKLESNKIAKEKYNWETESTALIKTITKIIH